MLRLIGPKNKKFEGEYVGVTFGRLPGFGLRNVNRSRLVCAYSVITSGLGSGSQKLPRKPKAYARKPTIPAA